MKLLLLLLISVACHAQTGGELDTIPAKFWFAKYDTTKFKPRSNELRLMNGNEMVAYRKKDSAWVFINPTGTISALEILAKRQMGWEPYEQPISLELPEQYFIPEGDSVKSYPRQYFEDSVLNIKNDTIYIKYDTIPADLIYRTRYNQTGWVRGWEVRRRVLHQPYYQLDFNADTIRHFTNSCALGNCEGKHDAHLTMCITSVHQTYLQSDRRPFPKGTRVAKVEGVREY